MYYSGDGESWQNAAGSFVSSDTVKGIIYGAGYYIAYGYDSNNAGKMAYSADGITWTDVALPPDTRTVRSLAKMSSSPLPIVLWAATMSYPKSSAVICDSAAWVTPHYLTRGHESDFALLFPGEVWG